MSLGNLCPLLDNTASYGPCDLGTREICASEECVCSSISYFLDAACGACLSNQTVEPIESWDDYAQSSGCTEIAQFPSPIPTGALSLPSWVLAMASATPTPTTFDLAAATAFAISSGATLPFSSALSTTPATSTSQSMNRGNIATPAPTDSQGSLPSTHRNTLRTGAIIGIIIGTCLIISLGLLLFWLRRHRRRGAYTEFGATPFPDVSTNINVADTGGSDSRSISTVRRDHLQNELRAAQSIIRLPPGCWASATDSGLVFELRERNEMLTTQIRELQAQIESPWALGFSDERPPSYS